MDNVRPEANGYAIYHDLTVEVPVDKVFKAVTEPGQLIHWWPLKCEGTPEKGAVYNFYFDEEYDWYGEVVLIDENRSFYIKMTKADEDWAPTVFGFDFEKVNDYKTLVRFQHTGWAECNAHFRRSSFCWAILLNGLKGYVEKGVIIPFGERQ